MARQQGLTEERIAASASFESQNFSEREKAALRFAEELTVDYRKVDEKIWENLRRHFSPQEIAQIAVFCAWQGNGLRVIHSWKAETLWTENRVPLPYTDESSIFWKMPAAGEDVRGGQKNVSASPARKPSTNGGLDEKHQIERAHAYGTPPQEWIAFLSHSPEALKGWSGFYRLVFTEGSVDPRLKIRLGAQMAHLLGTRVWFKSVWEGDGRGNKDIQAAPGFAGWSLGPGEKAALQYAERIAVDYLAVDDDLFGEMKRRFTDPELIEIGLYVGMMCGTLRLSYAMGLGRIP